MEILIPYYSRSGHTEQLALVLKKELEERGHSVNLEKIAVVKQRSKWRLALPLLSTVPVLPLILWLAPFRLWWLQHYPQAQQEIEALSHPNVSHFDCICLGGPKWIYIAYPIARYLEQVQGLAGKPVGAFATFCGPPLAVFEMEMLFAPLRHCIERRGAKLTQTLAVSSHFHEFFFFHELEYVFRLVSRIAFKRSLRSYTLDTAWGREEVNKFCDGLCAASASEQDASRSPALSRNEIPS